MVGRLQGLFGGVPTLETRVFLGVQSVPTPGTRGAFGSAKCTRPGCTVDRFLCGDPLAGSLQR